MLILHCNLWITAASVERRTQAEPASSLPPSHTDEQPVVAISGTNPRILGSNPRFIAACKWSRTDRRKEQQVMLSGMEKLVRTILVSSSVLQNGASCG